MPNTPAHRLTVAGGPTGADITRLQLDGRDIELSGLSIECGTDMEMRATLVVDWPGLDIDIESVIRYASPMPDRTANLLRALGWVPPAVPSE